MTIQITKPELEALINQRLKSGAFRDAEDVILRALQSPFPVSSAIPPPGAGHSDRSLREVFEAVRGLAEDAEFNRNPSTGRPMDLA
jgi:hypothetical protein